MPTYIGENKIVDRYLGDRFLEAAYIGDKKVYDPYTEIAGYLPINYKSRTAVALKNYRIYGTSAGAGVETENLFDKDAKDTNNGYVNSKYFNSSGEIVSGVYNISEYIKVEPNQNYTIYYGGATTTPALCLYDAEKNRVSIIVYNASPMVITTTSETTYMRISVKTNIWNSAYVVKGSTAPSTYIPHGYKLPLTVESGVTENLFDFDEYTIGDTKFATKLLTLEPNTAYTMSSNAPLYNYGALIVLMSIGESASTSTNGVYDGRPITKTTDARGKIYVGLRDNGSGYDLSTYKTMLVKGSTPPDHYIPHRYTSDIPIYIGPSKLGEEEYVDFGEQKVYKSSSDLWDVNGTTTNQRGETRPGNEFATGASYVVYNNSSTTLYYRVGVSTDVSSAIQSNTKLKITPNDTLVIWLPSSSYMSDVVVKTASYVDPPVPLPPIPTFKGENTLSSTETLGEVTVKGRIKEKPIVYGWHVDPSISDPTQAVTYLADAVGKAPAAMGASTFSYGDWENAFFMPKPCMLRSDGTVAYYLDPNDYTKKADGTASDVANASFDGNAMMEWPLIWYKFEAGNAEGEGYFYCSNKQVDDSYKCWCNLDCNGSIIPHFYTAMYNGTGISKLRSISGVQLTQANGSGNLSMQEEIYRAKANNTSTSVEWFTDVYCDRTLIDALLILLGKSLNTQKVFGKGIITGGQNSKQAYVTGSLNDKGMFYGDIEGTTSAVKVFGIENWWGCVLRSTAGLIGTSNGFAYKLTYSMADGTTVNGYSTSSTGYLTKSVTRPSGGYITKMVYGNHGFYPISTTGGTNSTYYCDQTFIGQGYARFGGAADYTTGCGAVMVNTDIADHSTSWAFSAALSCKPVKT